MTDLRLIEHFVAVYHRGSFRAGADALGVSQSTLTKSVQRLEQELGVRLFNRTTRSVQPTDNARQLIAAAESSLQAATSFRQEARLLAGGGIGAVRVGIIALAAEMFVADALAKLAHTHPGLEVEVVVGSADVYQDLATGLCDVVVGDEANFQSSPHARALRMTPLRSERLVVVHRRGHPAGKKPLPELLKYPWAIPSRYFNENRIFSGLAERVGSTADFPRYRLTSVLSCVELAAASEVITLAPISVARQAHPRPIAWREFELDIDVKLAVFTVANNALTPAVKALQSAFGALQ